MFDTMPVTWCVSVESDELGRQLDLAAERVRESIVEGMACSALEIEVVADCAEADIHIALASDAELGGGVLGALETTADGVVIYVNSDAAWTTRNAIDRDECNNAYLLESFVLQMAMRALDADTVHREMDPCTVDDFRIEDFEAISHVYGPLDAYAYSLVAVPVGVEACVALPVEEDTPVDVGWTFGDGAASAGVGVCHAWDTEGVFFVTADFSFAEQCGGWAREGVAWAEVQVCDLPHALGSSTELFSWELGAAGTLHVKNLVVGEGQGCVTATTWEVFDESGALLRSYDVADPGEITLGEAGAFRVVLEVVGPAGTATDDAVVTVPSEGCGCATGSTGAWGWVLGAVALLRRRR